VQARFAHSIAVHKFLRLFDAAPRFTTLRRGNKKPTIGLITEVGRLRFHLPFPYRASPPHSGALLQLQQMQAAVLILWLTGHFPSYSGTSESQFTEGHGGISGRNHGISPEARSGSNLVVSNAGESTDP
jgi:hypothetical protein